MVSPHPNTSAGVLDAHYTPATVAKLLVRASRELCPKLVADLAVGNGDLLFEAERIWPHANFVATDIDLQAVRRLTRLRPHWTIGRCDLRSARSRASCRALRALSDSACLMLLNPPFSCRGGTRYTVATSAGTLHASTAMSFLLLAARYVGEGGHIASVLPANCLHSQKDARAWDYLKETYSLQILQDCAMGTFPRSTASTVLVLLSPRTTDATTRPDPPRVVHSESRLHVRVIRGTCPIHRPQPRNNNVTLVHYTDIRDGTVHINGRRGFGAYRTVAGPAILIPRVGRLTVGKVALLDLGLDVMLSDCVIALRPNHPRHIDVLRYRLANNVAHLRGYYVGTGAPFITLDRLKRALANLAVQVDESP